MERYNKNLMQRVIDLENQVEKLILSGVSKSFTVDEIVSELEDSDHLDDAIMSFKESK